MSSWLEYIRRSGLGRNYSALLSAHGARQFAPLVIIPVAARALPTQEWSALLILQAIAGAVAALADFGIGISGQRDVARAHADGISKVVQRAWSAQLGAATVISLFAFLAGILLVGAGRVSMAGLVLGVSAGMADAVSPTWVFKGLERAWIVGVAELAGRGFFVMMVFLLIGAYPTAQMVIACGLAASTISMLAVLVVGIRSRLISWPSVAGVWTQLREAFPLMMLRTGGLVYNQLTLLLLGILTPVREFGGIGGAFRLVTALRTVGTPLVEAPFARMSAATDARTRRQLQLGSQAVIAVVMLPAAVVLAEARWVAVLAFGHDVGATAVPYLRGLAAAPWLGAATVSAGFGMLVATGHQREFALLALGSGLLVLLGVAVGGIFGVAGWGGIVGMNVAQVVMLWAILAHPAARAQRE